tara:strand:- start:365 stop:562 length:198 start_codon:yes stop_codon:yes gene_type:complete
MGWKWLLAAQRKRIEELEGDVRKSNIIHTAQNGAIDRLNARIAELEKRITQLTRSRKQFPNSRGM